MVGCSYCMVPHRMECWGDPHYCWVAHGTEGCGFTSLYGAPWHRIGGGGRYHVTVLCSTAQNGGGGVT